MKETHVFMGCYLFMIIISAEQVSLVLETHNIIIGVQDKNNSIKIRFCVIKIQRIDGQLSKVGNTNCWLPK